MTEVTVQKRPGAKEPLSSLLEDTRKLFEEIQQRAFHLFERRNEGDGSPLDDWICAEDEMCSMPATELAEDDKQFHLTAAVPGLKAKELKVTVAPQELIIQGETSKRDKGKRGDVRFSEFSEKQIFRRIELPSLIDVDHVEARLEDGMLSIDLPKTAQAQPVKIEKGKSSKKAAVA
jgi:HSP20 family molecular chaperone IbpA